MEKEPSRKAGMRRGVLMKILEQNAAQLPRFLGKTPEKYRTLCLNIVYFEAVVASGDLML